jgi:beta-glucosidase/6-phospho-beta-glucosidase/beta-galactosidase
MGGWIYVSSPKLKLNEIVLSTQHIIFSQKFGIYSVDFNDPGRPRAQKLSGKTYAQIIADNGFPAPATK